jgi:nitrite reductase (NADH) small subunit/3-phenylpropionate/trans-cinnamate dioxygenase ferredoxin subunit
MAEYRTACKAADVPEGEGRTCRVGDKLVAVFHDADGFFALDDMCPHMGASLGDGRVENGIVTCPWHAWRFRLRDGAWADSPRVKIGCYPVQVVDGLVQVLIEGPPAPTGGG